MKDIYDSIFKAYDIRGKVNEELTPEVLQNVGAAFSDFLPNNGPIAIGYDMRPDSKTLAESLMSGITGRGRDVVNIGQVTSDMIYFAVGHFQLAGGAMVTASHNPGEYNGVKFCGEAAKAIGIESGLINIKENALKAQFAAASAPGKIISKDILADWVTHVLSFIDPAKMKQLSIVVDAGNGMAGSTFPDLAAKLPLKVHEMYFEPDGTFPNHIANPLEPENLKDIRGYMSDNSVDVGIAFDGDGDRAVLLDEKGDIVTGTQLTALLADYFLNLEPKATILCNAICGRDVDDLVKAKGGTLHRTKVGHSFIKADMRKYGALFAGEHSGHYYFRDNFNADSGLIAATIALYVLATSEKPLSALTAQYTHYVQITETNFEVQDKAAIIGKIKAEFKDASINELDGVTVTFENKSWFNVRPSNTEPLLRLNAEAASDDDLQKIVKQVSSLITS